MNKEFIPYEQALELKELGFEEPCFMNWYQASNGFVLVDEINQSFQQYISAPLYQQAFRWFREKHGLFANHLIYMTMDGGFALESIEEDDQTDGLFNTYEEAELACLKKLIGIVKNK